MATNKQSHQQRQAVEDAATTILAYLDMGNDEEVQRLLAGADRHGLGLIITTWFQMCIARRGVKVTLEASRKAMEFFNTQAKLDGKEKEDIEADQLTASLLSHLTDNAMDRYARAWQRVIDAGLCVDVAARLLGFTRGMLIDTPETEEEEQRG